MASNSHTITQIELNKKREAELMKLKGELEEASRFCRYLYRCCDHFKETYRCFCKINVNAMF